MVIAIVGMPGSGKSAVAEQLKLKGLPIIRFGQIVVDELIRLGLEINPHNERQVREDLRATFGMDVCARRSIPMVRSAYRTSPIVVVDGLYGWTEYKTLKAEFREKLTVIAVVAAREIRYERLRTRGVRPLTRDEAEVRDVAEIESLEKGGPIAIADYFLPNEGSLDSLHVMVEDLFRKSFVSARI